MKKAKKVDFNPLVSIVIPVYNGANYVAEAIDSALAQTYKNIEIIVVNDGSTDNTEEIVKSYGNKLRYFKKENGGVSTALNLGIREAKGEYISWLSHDDMYYPDKIEKQVKFVVENKLVGKDVVLYGNYSKIFSDSGKIFNKKLDLRVVKNIRCLLAIDLKNTLNGCTMLLSKKIFINGYWFDVSLKYTQDYDLWFRLTKFVDFFYIDSFFLYSRQHEGQGGKQNPINATLESDLLHSNMILSLTNEEVDKYCDRSPDFLYKIYKIFLISGYSKTSYRLLRHICRLCFNSGLFEKVFKVFNKEVLSLSIYHDYVDIFKNKNFFSKKNKKRILFYSNVWIKGGIERVLSMVIDYLSKEYDVILVSSNLEIGNCFKLNNSVLHLKVSKDNISSRLAALCVVLGVDIFVGNPNIDVDFLDVYKVLYELKIKSIACNHYYYFLPALIRYLHPILNKRLEAYDYATLVSWPTNFATNIFNLIKENGVYLPNPNTFETKNMRRPVYKKNILCVGRFNDSIKRLDKIFIIFSEVIKINMDAELTVVGTVNLDVVSQNNGLTYNELLSSLKIPLEKIHFVGEVDCVESYYKKADLLLLTSECEGFGMVINEAAVFGVPSIVFKTPGLDELISDGKNGFIVDQDNYSGAVDKINLLISNPNIRRKMSKNAVLLSKRFKKNVVLGRWLKLIRMLLDVDTESELKARVKKDFFVPIKNKQKFMVEVVHEYERCLVRTIVDYSKQNIVCCKKNLIKVFFSKNREKEQNIMNKIYVWPVVGHLLVRIYLRIKKIFFLYER